jgi:hypothetical protein
MGQTADYVHGLHAEPEKILAEYQHVRERSKSEIAQALENLGRRMPRERTKSDKTTTQ